jgi:Na+-translocating ferredoxin:NAD+ oxidoreductase RnfA subunit
MSNDEALDFILFEFLAVQRFIGRSARCPTTVCICHQIDFHIAAATIFSVFYFVNRNVQSQRL